MTADTQAERKIQSAAMDADTQDALRVLAKTKAGQKFLVWLMSYCGFKASSLTVDKTGYPIRDAILHNEALRLVWLVVRKRIPAESLNLIEMEK